MKNQHLYLLCSFFGIFAMQVRAQNFTSFFTGSESDIVTSPQGGVCMMGGATEDDEAMKWFLNRADGGDVLVLRASGSDGYNNYFYSQLGVSVNSVETIRFNNAQASFDAYVLERIEKAEAIWFAGGDQWNYISYWRNTPVDSLINKGIAERNIVVGGTSAGMAILGSHYFSAQNGTITSNAALQNPFNNNVTVDNTPFLQVPYMNQVITDTHYDNPDRRGRHSVFLARILSESGIHAKGIACDEYTALCIDENGIAKVFGGYPNYDDNAYFIQTNCESNNPNPEVLEPNQALTWNLNGEALKVYAVKGTSTGANTFDLNDWKTGNGGSWQHWSINNGNFTSDEGIEPDCQQVSINTFKENVIQLYPNPFNDQVTIFDLPANCETVQLFSMDGRLLTTKKIANQNQVVLETTSLGAGTYILLVIDKTGNQQTKKLVKSIN